MYNGDSYSRRESDHYTKDAVDASCPPLECPDVR